MFRKFTGISSQTRDPENLVTNGGKATKFGDDIEIVKLSSDLRIVCE